MGRSAEQVYLDLTRIPNAQWANIISKLPAKMKQELMQLIKQKRELKQQQLQTPSSQPPLLPSTSDSISAAPLNEEHIETTRPFKRRKTSINNEFVSPVQLLPSSASSSQSEAINSQESRAQSHHSNLEKLPTQQNPNIIFSPFKSLRILSVYPLDRIRSLMYVAGDANNVLIESEQAVHRYLNFWLAAVIQSAVRIFVQQQTITEQQQKQPNNNKNWEVGVEGVNQFWNNRRKVAVRLEAFLQAGFPVEFEKFDRDANFQRSARRKFSDSLQEDQAKPSTVDQETFCVDANTANLNCNLAKSLLPSDRFMERLKARDLRTRSFTQLEYQIFAKSREKSLRACKPLVSEWLNMAATVASSLSSSSSSSSSSSANDSTEHRRHFPPSCLEFLLFLISDRVASIVELALLLRATALDPSPDFPNAASRLMNNIQSATELWEKGFSFPSLVSILESNLNRNSAAADNSNSAAKNLRETPLLPQHYKVAIDLMTHYIDVPIFQLTEDNLKFIETGLPSLSPAPSKQRTAKQQQQLDELQQPTVTEAITTRQNNMIAGRIHNPTATAAALFMPQSELSKEANDLFEQIVLLATRNLAPPAVPRLTATFAYLFCRDLFWDKRHEPAPVLWRHIIERYREWEKDEPRRMLLEEKYKQIVNYAEAVRKIVALDQFFESMKTSTKSHTGTSSSSSKDR